MKTNIKLFMAIILFILTKPSFSQDNKFIEISASDTIELKPVAFTYQIGFKQKIDYMGYSASLSGSDTIPSPPIIVIVNLLKTNKFIYEISNQNDYTITNSSSIDTIILVTLNSEKELKRLTKALISFKGISGKIKETKYESLSLYNKELFKSLYSRALSDATIIANASGNSVGKLISVGEIKESSTDYLSNYADLLKEIPFYKNQDNLNKKIIKKLFFKFQMQ